MKWMRLGRDTRELQYQIFNILFLKSYEQFHYRFSLTIMCQL